MIVDASVKGIFGGFAYLNLVDDELHEVGIAVSDDLLDVFDSVILTGPDCQPCGPVSIETGAACGHPVAQPLPRVSEVSMPAQWGRAVLVRVIGAEPVQMERRQLPEQLGVSVPEWWDHRRWEPVLQSEPVHPAIEFKQLLFEVVRGEQVPIDWVWRFSHQISIVPRCVREVIAFIKVLLSVHESIPIRVLEAERRWAEYCSLCGGFKRSTLLPRGRVLACNFAR